MLKKSSSFVLASLRELGASPQRHWALTNSRPSANATLITLRVADLPAALHAERRVLARRGREGEINGLFEHPAAIPITSSRVDQRSQVDVEGDHRIVLVC